MIRAVLIALLALMLSSNQAAALTGVTGETGNSLLEKCRSYENVLARRQDIDDLFNAGGCAGYILAVVDLAGAQLTTLPKHPCFSANSNLNYGQVIDVVVKVLNTFHKKNPTELHKPAFLLVLAALAIAFPCN